MSFPETDPEAGWHFPDIWDVFRVRYLLQWKLSEGFPAELVDQIIDAAEYWPSTEHHMVEEANSRIVRNDRDQVLLKTVPLCYSRKSLEQSPLPKPLPHRGIHPCRKVVFRISSHDQGGRGTSQDYDYSESWTWFDIEVIREAHTRNMYVDGEEQELLHNERGQVTQHYEPTDELLLPRQNKVQSNAKRSGHLQNNTIVWHYLDDIGSDSAEAFEIERTKGRGRFTLDGRFVRELEVGDSIALWARARFPAWTNYVSKASVRVFWAV
ncbi:hypothetical protein N7466_011343 [Penicillium verhagenii]|uniref:uncharacterized protein n=1 Tax=Penicillium verhagenii TaxID=1562060 RepID=UPI002545031D|nr:uncharacterized protein N7466_011343 [Penicillium verhagenii]KAJ5915410.1 hypothetical protein N7466_011343 [Penicillium verhagenii]